MVVGPRTLARLLVVTALLLIVFAWRLDGAMRTAYQTGWCVVTSGLKVSGPLPGQLFSDPCKDGDLRLPGTAWIAAHAVASLLAVLLLALTVILYRWRSLATSRSPQTLRAFVLVTSGSSVFLAGLASFARWRAGQSVGDEWVKAASLIESVALIALAVSALAVANACRILGQADDASKGSPLLGQLRRLLQRQRINILGVALLALALTLIAETKGQAIDSIRTWSLTSAHGAARLSFGVATAVLLALVVYESGLLLSQMLPRSATDPSGVPFKFWLPCALLAAALGWGLQHYLPLGHGLLIAAGLLLLLGLLELPRSLPERRSVSSSGLAAPEPLDEHAPEYLAAVPLLSIAATSVVAAVDAGLSGEGAFEAFQVVAPGLVLAAGAVLMTAERPAPRLDVPRLRTWLLGLVIVVVSSILLVKVVRRETAAAVLGGAACLAVFLYAFLIFRAPVRGSVLAAARRSALSLPLGFAAGFACFVAVHSDAHVVGETLGTFALANIALAAVLAGFHFAIRGSLLYRPPLLLWWLGLEQMPIVSLLLLWWIGAGVLWPPKTLHDIPLVERVPIATSNGLERPAAPTLKAAFAQWVKAQPELRASAAKTDRPVPLFLIASQGGGIRAAYWTGLVLDCIVGVSAEERPFTQLRWDDDRERSRTCKEHRRSPAEQRAAARRIFLVSGVSGGAVGFYAYARQLLAHGDLGDGTWVPERLGRDFASATIAWGLFHDLPNHLLGLHPRSGGACSLRASSVCLSRDRSAILDEAFDRAWGDDGEAALLRHTWDLRAAEDVKLRELGEPIPLIITNATVSGGSARAVVSAANLGYWPSPDVYDVERGNYDAYPLAGTIEISDVLCRSWDLRLSTAALLGARFPYVSPSGRLPGHCGKPGGLGRDRDSDCGLTGDDCATSLVDGGYVDNSGLLTIDALWPSLRQLVIELNRRSPRPVAPVIVELDNHYQEDLGEANVPIAGQKLETFIPPLTAYSARNAIEMYARAHAFRIRPPTCTVTISPGLHPGLTAPLGWELSEGARDDLPKGLVRPFPHSIGASRDWPIVKLRRLQDWLRSDSEPDAGYTPRLVDCVPKE